MEIEELLTKIAEILEKIDIPYVITGGMAVSVWGRPRYTADIDIIVELLPKNINLLAKELLTIDKNVYISQEAMIEALENEGEFNFIHPQSGLKVDFWVIKDRFRKQQIKRGIIKKIEKQEVNFISPEDLILSKLIWFKETNSQKQLEDIESVLKNPKIKFDLEYIKKWAEIQEVNDILEKLLKK